MKILLLGEYSALHKNLRDGLHEIGHNVTIAASGDGWKKIPSDIDISIKSKNLISKIVSRFILFNKFLTFKNFDVVQIINPDILYIKYFPSRYIFNYIRKNNKKVFLLAAGDDGYFWRYARQKLKYGPFDDFLKYDLMKKIDPHESAGLFCFNKYMADNVNGIIPVMYEYQIGYVGHRNLKKIIPIPMNTNEVVYRENIIKNKLVIFHGLNRPGFKGTRYIESAFSILKDRYPDDLELVVEGNLPLTEYLEVMKKTNIVIDQVNSHSLGVNGLFALAMGKIVMGGAEPESLTAFGVNESPVINITSDVTDIVKKIESLMINKSQIARQGYMSRLYVEKIHNYKNIALLYLNCWHKA